MEAEAGLRGDVRVLVAGVRSNRFAVGLEVLAVAVVKHVAVGFALRLVIGVDGGRIGEHAHRVAGGRNAVHDDVFGPGVEVLLLHG